jgi:hypothetical protein
MIKIRTHRMFSLEYHFSFQCCRQCDAMNCEITGNVETLFSSLADSSTLKGDFRVGAHFEDVLAFHVSVKGLVTGEKYRKYKSHIFILQAVKYHPIVSHLL